MVTIKGQKPTAFEISKKQESLVTGHKCKAQQEEGIPNSLQVYYYHYEVYGKLRLLFYVKLVKLVHNHPDSSGFGGFLMDFLWTLATIFFFQNSLGLPYLYQSLNTNGLFFIRIQSGDNTSSHKPYKKHYFKHINIIKGNGRSKKGQK